MPNLSERYKEVHGKLDAHQCSVLCAPNKEKQLQSQLDVLWRSMTEYERLEINRWVQKQKQAKL